jgi:hypothetical protein
MGELLSIPESVTRLKNLLLTGAPDCDKTTVLKRVAEHLADLRLAGFLTVEVREHGQRVCANHQEASIEHLVDRFIRYIQGLSPEEARRKAGILSENYWLREACQN